MKFRASSSGRPSAVALSALTAFAVVIPASAVRADDSGTRDVTFARDVAPIFQQSCQECHRPGDIAPMSLLTYEESRPWAKSIREAVTNRTMPPYHAEKTAFEFANDISLSEEEIDTITRWVDQGAKLGDPKDLPAPVKFPEGEWKSGEPDLVLDIGFDYTLGADVNDEYRCFVLDPGLAEDTWYQGVEYKPGNRQVVHHIMAYADVKGVGRELDEADPDPGFVCGMSGAGAGGTGGLDNLMGGWAPGTPPNMFSEGIGRMFPGGSDIIYQVHYHNTSGTDQIDRSAMAFYFARKPINAAGKISLVGAYVLDIPAGEANAVHKGTWRAPYDLKLYTAMPHMHYIGKAMKVDVTFPDGRKEVLLDVPRFDFNWQTVYAFKEPLFLPKGTRLHMTSVHDNSAENPYNPFSPPRPMAWGEATDEEMAHCWLSIVRADENLGIIPTPPVIGSVKGETKGTAGGL